MSVGITTNRPPSKKIITHVLWFHFSVASWRITRCMETCKSHVNTHRKKARGLARHSVSTSTTQAVSSMHMSRNPTTHTRADIASLGPGNRHEKKRGNYARRQDATMWQCMHCCIGGAWGAAFPHTLSEGDVLLDMRGEHGGIRCSNRALADENDVKQAEPTAKSTL